MNPGYLALENVVLLPHLGSATVATRDAMGFLALDGIDAVLVGRHPQQLGQVMTTQLIVVISGHRNKDRRQKNKYEAPCIDGAEICSR